MNNLYRLLALVALLALLFAARRHTTTWANPMTFLAGPFALIFIFQQIFIPNVAFGWRAGVVIVSAALALFIGMLIAWPQRESDLASVEGPVSSALVFRWPKWIGLALVIAVYAVSLIYLFQLSAIRESGSATVNEIFHREVQYAVYGESIALRASQALNYAGAFFLAFYLRTGRFGLLLTLPIVLIYVAQSLAGSAKLTAILASLILVVAATSNMPTELRRIRKKTLAGLGLLAIVTGTVFGLVTQDRSAGTSDIGQITTYAVLGSPSVLSERLDGNAYESFEQVTHLGTFAGPLSVLLGEDRALGAYSVSVVLGDTPESASNVYTGLRPLLDDFGIVGLWVVMLVLGVISGRLTRASVLGRLGVRGQGVLAMTTLFLCYLPLNVLTYYNFFYLLLAMCFPLGWIFAVPSRRNVPLDTRAAQPQLTS